MTPLIAIAKMVSVISAILLAAGESKRMGRAKQLLPLGEKSILEHSLDNLLESTVDEVIVVLGSEAEKVSKKMAGRPVKVMINPDYQRGMGTSIAKGMDSISETADAVMLVLADQPFIASKIINRLIDGFETGNKGIAVPVYKGRRGHPIIFAIKYKSELSGLQGDTGGKEIIEKHPNDILEVGVDAGDIHVDIDDMESYKRLEKRRGWNDNGRLA